MRLTYCYLILLILLIACSSPQKSFDKGQYEKAFSTALKNLEKKKGKRTDRSVLNLAFQEIYNDKLIDAERYLQSDMLEDWEEAFDSYDDLIEFYYDGKAYLDKDFDPLMDVVQEDKESLQKDLAKNYHDLGMMSMQGYADTGSKLYAQDAFRYFEKTRRYQKDFPEINDLIDDAFSKGVIDILVEADAPFAISYAWEIDNRFDDVERESSGFLQIHYKRLLQEVDCVLEIDFSDLDRDVSRSSRVENFSEQVEDGFNTTVDTSGRETKVQKYKTIEGSVITITERISYDWRIAVSVRGDRDYCDFDQKYFNTEEVVVIESYELSGDTDAIPSSFKNNNNTRIDEDDIVDDLIEDLYDQFVQYYF